MDTILVTPRGYAKYGEKEKERLESLGYQVDINDTGNPLPREIFEDKAKKAAGIIVGVDRLDQDLLRKCGNLRAIVKFGVGTDNIDLNVCREMGIRVERCVGTNSNAVAEFTIAMMFACARNLISNAMDVKERKWTKPTGFELRGKKLGIIGFGNIGKKVARMARGIGMEIYVYDVALVEPKVLRSCGAVQKDLKEILRTCDFITLHVPLMEDTKNMISKKEFQLMKKNAVLINAARGGIVDEKALYAALKEQEIYACASDVFTMEPPEDKKWIRELLSMERFTLTAHIASRSEEAEINTVKAATNHMIDLLREKS